MTVKERINEKRIQELRDAMYLFAGIQLYLDAHAESTKTHDANLQNYFKNIKELAKKDALLRYELLNNVFDPEPNRYSEKKQLKFNDFDTDDTAHTQLVALYDALAGRHLCLKKTARLGLNSNRPALETAMIMTATVKKSLALLYPMSYSHAVVHTASLTYIGLFTLWALAVTDAFGGVVDVYVENIFDKAIAGVQSGLNTSPELSAALVVGFFIVGLIAAISVSSYLGTKGSDRATSEVKSFKKKIELAATQPVHDNEPVVNNVDRVANLCAFDRGDYTREEGSLPIKVIHTPLVSLGQQSEKKGLFVPLSSGHDPSDSSSNSTLAQVATAHPLSSSPEHKQTPFLCVTSGRDEVFVSSDLESNASTSAVSGVAADAEHTQSSTATQKMMGFINKYRRGPADPSAPSAMSKMMTVFKRVNV